MQACLNGGRSKTEHSAVPVSRTEIAADAVAVRAAGAAELHVHPRSADGRESLAPDDVARWLEKLRKQVPDMPVGVSTGVWIEPHLAARLAQIDAWDVMPGYASVNVSEEGAAQSLYFLVSRGNCGGVTGT